MRMQLNSSVCILCAMSFVRPCIFCNLQPNALIRYVCINTLLVDLTNNSSTIHQSWHWHTPLTLNVKHLRQMAALSFPVLFIFQWNKALWYIFRSRQYKFRRRFLCASVHSAVPLVHKIEVPNQTVHARVCLVRKYLGRDLILDRESRLRLRSSEELSWMEYRLLSILLLQLRWAICAFSTKRSSTEPRYFFKFCFGGKTPYTRSVVSFWQIRYKSVFFFLVFCYDILFRNSFLKAIQ